MSPPGIFSIASVTSIVARLLAGHSGPGMLSRMETITIDVSTCNLELKCRLLEALRQPMRSGKLQALLGAAPHDSWKAELAPHDVTVPCYSCHFNDDSPNYPDNHTADEMLREHPMHMFVPMSVNVTLPGGREKLYYELKHPFADEVDECERLMDSAEDIWGDAIRLRAEFWRLAIMALEPKLAKSAPLQTHEAASITARWRFEQPGTPLTLAAGPLLSALVAMRARAAAPAQ